MTWEALLAGVGAILTGAGGCILILAEFRRRDRRSLKLEIYEMTSDLIELRADVIACRRYAYMLAAILIEHGIEVPADPEYEHGEP